MGMISHCPQCGKDLPRERWVTTNKGFVPVQAYLSHREVFCSEKCWDIFVRKWRQ